MGPTPHTLFQAVSNAQNVHGCGQKLNLIVEDIVCLFETKFQGLELPFSSHALWGFCFHPVTTLQEHMSLYSVIYSSIESPGVTKFLETVCVALEDPPKEWWIAQQSTIV
jgi:hypothetical protein